MGNYRRPITLLILLFLVLLLPILSITPRYEVQASSNSDPQLQPQVELGTGFTYQGQLKKNGSTVNASCNFTFSLWDAEGSGTPPIGGNQLGQDQIINNVTISNGLFSVTLNSGSEFGADAFNGDARWLQISLTCPGDVDATTLSPRQAITPAPYALASPGSAYQNVVIVAKHGGDYTSIQAALDSILDASPSNPYLVWIAPGVYTEQVTMKPYVDIEGAGQLTTKITFTGSSTNTTGSLITASNAELRSLTVENTGGDVYAIAIFNNGTSPRLTDITATAGGDNNISAAIFSDASASPIISHVDLQTTGLGFNHYTLYSRGSSTNTVYNSTISAYGGSTNNYGVIGTVASIVNIHNSVIWGVTDAVSLINSTGRIATSQLIGGVSIADGATLVCVGAYNESFVALDFNCQ